MDTDLHDGKVPFPRTYLWKEVRPETISGLIGACRVAHLRQDERMTFPIALVLDGSIGQLATSSKGRVALVSIYVQHDLIDTLDVPQLSSAPLTALTACNLLVIEPEAFREEISQHADLGKAVAATARQQFKRLQDHVAELALKTPLERLASFLDHLHDETGRSLNTLRLPMRHYDIARYLNIQPETLSRNMRKLATMGVIDIESADLLNLRDLAQLDRIARGSAG